MAMQPPAVPSAPAPAAGNLGTPRSAGTCILLAIVTLGIYTYVWTYKTHKEMADHTGQGVGGVLGFVIYFLLSPVTYFLIPSEIRKMLERDGRTSPVTGIWGLWFLLPLIGSLIWFIKMQGTLNTYWTSKGATA